MEPREDTISSQDVVEVIAAEPMAEAAVADVAEAVPGVAVVREGPTPNTQHPTPHTNGQLCDCLECMLFVSTEPLSANQIAEALQIGQDSVEEAMSALEARLDGVSGLQLMRVAGGYQLCTRPEFADYCAIILQPARKRLSKAALETLAIVAYRQPCTQPEVEAVRGVSVDGVIKTLQDRGLVKEAGRKQTPGRPILYATTPEFLEYFGLNDISELPDIDLLAVEEIKALEAQRELFTREGVRGKSEERSGEDEAPAEPMEDIEAR